MFNTTKLNKAISDSKSLRRATLMQKAPYYTTMAGALAAGINAAGINRGRATLAALPRFGSFFQHNGPRRPPLPVLPQCLASTGVNRQSGCAENKIAFHIVIGPRCGSAFTLPC
jgi:hypothetical protein